MWAAWPLIVLQSKYWEDYVRKEPILRSSCPFTRTIFLSAVYLFDKKVVHYVRYFCPLYTISVRGFVHGILADKNGQVPRIGPVHLSDTRICPFMSGSRVFLPALEGLRGSSLLQSIYEKRSSTSWSVPGAWTTSPVREPPQSLVVPRRSARQ